MRRVVTPEQLDSLPADSPAARHSRRDLRIFNRSLGASRWWRQTLPTVRRELSADAQGLDLGAGDGEVARAHGFHALDIAPPPPDWPATLTWHHADITTFDAWPNYPLVCANLFLHHFSTATLGEIGARLDQHARIIVACEPWRARVFQSGFAALCFAIRAHAVSRHDGHVSIAAGFRGDELPRLLGLSAARWHCTVRHHPLGTYRLVARRLPA